MALTARAPSIYKTIPNVSLSGVGRSTQPGAPKTPTPLPTPTTQPGVQGPSPSLTPNAPTPLPGAPTGTPSTFSASNNLIATQIPGGTSPQTQQYGQATTGAFGAASGFDRAGTQQASTDRYRSIYGSGEVGYTPVQTQQAYRPVETQVQGGPSVTPNDSAALSRYRGLLGDSATALTGLPDRVQTAQSMIDAEIARSRPQFDAELQDATKLAAANGVLGSGMLADRYGTITNQRTQNLDALRTKLIGDATNESINDRYRTLSSLQGLVGDTASQEAGQRGELRTERGYNTGLASDNLARAASERDTQSSIDAANLGRASAERGFATDLARDNQASQFSRNQAAVGQGAADANAIGNDRYRALDAAASLQGQSFGQDQTEQSALRGERAYQYGLSQDAQSSAIQQYLAELQARGVDFGEGVTLNQLGNAGANSLLNTYGDTQASYGNDAASAFGALGTARNQAAQASSQSRNDALIRQILQSIAGGA